MPENDLKSMDIIDVHAHLYPEGSFTEVLKNDSEFELVENPRGQSLVYRGSHVMSMPVGQADIALRLASMDEAHRGASRALALLSRQPRAVAFSEPR